MLKKLSFLFLALLLCVQLASVGAAQEYAYDRYNQEVSGIVGSLFGIQAEDVCLTILSGEAEIVRTSGGEYLRLTTVGDVLLNANFAADKYSRCDYRYLVHVLPQGSEAFQEEGADFGNDVREPAGDADQFPQQVLELVNEERARVGAQPLRLAADLGSGAAVRAQEITQHMSHTRPNGQRCFTVLDNRHGYLGENIAAGSPTPAEVVDQWMHSDGHRANILNKNFRELGVGYAYVARDAQNYFHYWVQLFRG